MSTVCTISYMESAGGLNWASSPSIGILTALPREFAAVRSLLRDHRIEGDYDLGVFPGRGSTEHLVAIRICGIGTTNAARITNSMVTYYPSIRDVIFVGIAAGCPNSAVPEHHVRLGDVVVAGDEGIFQYDRGKLSANGKLVKRPGTTSPSPRLTEAYFRLAAEVELGADPWAENIARAASLDGFARPSAASDVLKDRAGVVVPHPTDPDRVEGASRVFRGGIASGNAVVRDSRLRDRLRDELGARVIEMESSGMAEAALAANVNSMSVRGVCDYADGNKTDIWQRFSAAAAAGFCASLLGATPGTDVTRPNVLPDTPGGGRSQRSLALSGLRPSTPLAGSAMVEYQTAHFTGRRDEVARLVAFLQPGASSAMVVEGPGGIGKSALISRAIQMASPIDDTVVVRHVVSKAAHTSSAHSFLSTALLKMAPDTPLEVLKDLDSLRSAFETVWYTDRAEEPNVVLIVDGLDEQDAGPLSIVDVLPRDFSDRRKILVATRPNPQLLGLLPDGHPLCRADNVVLSAFTRDEICELARHILSLEPSVALVTDIVRVSAGSPLFASHIVRWVHTNGIDPSAALLHAMDGLDRYFATQLSEIANAAGTDETVERLAALYVEARVPVSPAAIADVLECSPSEALTCQRAFLRFLAGTDNFVLAHDEYRSRIGQYVGGEARQWVRDRLAVRLIAAAKDGYDASPVRKLLLSDWRRLRDAAQSPDLEFCKPTLLRAHLSEFGTLEYFRVDLKSELLAVGADSPAGIQLQLVAGMIDPGARSVPASVLQAYGEVAPLLVAEAFIASTSGSRAAALIALARRAMKTDEGAARVLIRNAGFEAGHDDLARLQTAFAAAEIDGLSIDDEQGSSLRLLLSNGLQASERVLAELVEPVVAHLGVQAARRMVLRSRDRAGKVLHCEDEIPQAIDDALVLSAASLLDVGSEREARLLVGAVWAPSVDYTEDDGDHDADDDYDDAQDDKWWDGERLHDLISSADIDDDDVDTLEYSRWDGRWRDVLAETAYIRACRGDLSAALELIGREASETQRLSIVLRALQSPALAADEARVERILSEAQTQFRCHARAQQIETLLRGERREAGLQLLARMDTEFDEVVPSILLSDPVAYWMLVADIRRLAGDWPGYAVEAEKAFRSKSASAVLAGHEAEFTGMYLGAERLKLVPRSTTATRLVEILYSSIGESGTDVMEEQLQAAAMLVRGSAEIAGAEAASKFVRDILSQFVGHLAGRSLAAVLGDLAIRLGRGGTVGAALTVLHAASDALGDQIDVGEWMSVELAAYLTRVCGSESANQSDTFVTDNSDLERVLLSTEALTRSTSELEGWDRRDGDVERLRTAVRLSPELVACAARLSLARTMVAASLLSRKSIARFDRLFETFTDEQLVHVVGRRAADDCLALAGLDGLVSLSSAISSSVWKVDALALTSIECVRQGRDTDARRAAMSAYDVWTRRSSALDRVGTAGRLAVALRLSECVEPLATLGDVVESHLGAGLRGRTVPGGIGATARLIVRAATDESLTVSSMPGESVDQRFETARLFAYLRGPQDTLDALLAAERFDGASFAGVLSASAPAGDGAEVRQLIAAGLPHLGSYRQFGHWFSLAWFALHRAHGIASSELFLSTWRDTAEWIRSSFAALSPGVE